VTEVQLHKVTADTSVDQINKRDSWKSCWKACNLSIWKRGESSRCLQSVLCGCKVLPR